MLGGIFLAWIAFATPVIAGLTPNVQRPTPAQLATGGLIWGLTLVAPPSFAIVGALRIGRVARAITAKPTPRAMTRVAKAIGDEYTAAADVRLPDGRVIRDLVLGPFGMAVINELPNPRTTRHTGVSWEIRRADGAGQRRVRGVTDGRQCGRDCCGRRAGAMTIRLVPPSRREAPMSSGQPPQPPHGGEQPEHGQQSAPGGPPAPGEQAPYGLPAGEPSADQSSYTGAKAS